MESRTLRKVGKNSTIELYPQAIIILLFSPLFYVYFLGDFLNFIFQSII
jgi:hypothetical protein